MCPQVGSEWDGKESIFRNYGGIIGAWDEPVAALRLKGGVPGEVSIIWDDPVGERVSTFVMKLEASWFVSYHKPKVDRPIRPGVWTVSVQVNPKANGPILMENKVYRKIGVKRLVFNSGFEMAGWFKAFPSTVLPFRQKQRNCSLPQPLNEVQVTSRI